MKFLGKKVKRRIYVFISSAVIAITLLVTYQSIVYAAKLDADDRQSDKITAIRSAEWNAVNVIIKDTIEQAGQKLDQEIIPALLDDINSYYGDDTEKLSHDLENLANPDYDNPLTHTIAKHIRGKYLFGVTSDANDIFALTKKDGVIADLSVSTSSPERPRSLSAEANAHYNVTLANSAFSAIVNQARSVNQPVIFWQFNQPDDTYAGSITGMKLSEMRKYFEENNGSLDSLRSFEFLVPRYIFFDHDLLGNELVDDRGVQHSIYQIVLVQGFSITEIIENTDMLDSIYNGINVNDIANVSGYLSLSRMQQILIFGGLFVITCWVQFSVQTKRKYVDQHESTINI
jgi:hypothetical protein